MLMMLLQIWMDYSSGRHLDTTYEEVGWSSALVVRGGGVGGGRDAADYVRPINWKRAAPLFFFFLRLNA